MRVVRRHLAVLGSVHGPDQCRRHVTVARPQDAEVDQPAQLVQGAEPGCPSEAGVPVDVAALVGSRGQVIIMKPLCMSIGSPWGPRS